jgi:hypothetical protein
LAHIVNLSLKSGIVPDQLKIARVLPLFKSGDNNMSSNNRPISVLPIFSKIFEKVVYNRLITYFNKYDILFKNQYGFRKGHSTSLALHHLFDNITKAADQKEYTIGVFIDLSKAFDTVIHEISINKLIKALWNDGTRNDDVCTRLYPIRLTKYSDSTRQ